jgi:predicted ATPase
VNNAAEGTALAGFAYRRESVCVVPVGLCEREGELERVDALLAAARAGHGDALLITGPAGIGKTVLLAAARERAGQAGMRVLAGRGGELESGFSFGVARQLFEPLLAGAGAAEREALLAGAARRARPNGRLSRLT